MGAVARCSRLRLECDTSHNLPCKGCYTRATKLLFAAYQIDLLMSTITNAYAERTKNTAKTIRP